MRRRAGLLSIPKTKSTRSAHRSRCSVREKSVSRARRPAACGVRPARSPCRSSSPHRRGWRWTLDRWIADWRRGGFDGLVPSMRQSQPRTPAEVLQLASALKKENPNRSAAQVRRILLAQLGWAPDERTLQRMFNRSGLSALRRPHQAEHLQHRGHGGQGRTNAATTLHSADP